MERSLCLLFVTSLLANAFCAPTPAFRLRRAEDDEDSDDLQNISSSTTSITTTTEKTVPTTDSFDGDDDDDDDFDDLTPAPSNDGSNVFSLLRLVTGLFPGSSSANIVENMLNMILKQMTVKTTRRQFVKINEIENNNITKVKTKLQKQENEITSAEGGIEESNDNVNVEDNIRDISKENSDSNLDSIEEDSGYDSDEPLGGGDGGGGGILGLIAGLSGGEDGQSDLGSLLATVSGIVANLSGDGIDLNSLIASGIGLFAGLLSEGEENPGAVIASYLLTSLDTITGGGAQNNGAFFGNFLSKLVKGTSAAGDSDTSSEDGNKPMADSGGFVASFIISLLGDMSKSSSGGSSHR